MSQFPGAVSSACQHASSRNNSTTDTGSNKDTNEIGSIFSGTKQPLAPPCGPNIVSDKYRNSKKGFQTTFERNIAPLQIRAKFNASGRGVDLTRHAYAGGHRFD